MNNKILGNRGEQAAASYLMAHGYQILERNYRCPVGEIDIVASRGTTVIFVEVKTRRSLAYGRPCEAVDYRKQQKIIKTASWYIQGHNLSGRSLRFDVLEVFAQPGGSMQVNHIQGAFETT